MISVSILGAAGQADWLRAGGASSNKLSLTFSNVGHRGDNYQTPLGAQTKQNNQRGQGKKPTPSTYVPRFKSYMSHSSTNKSRKRKHVFYFTINVWVFG